jgi:pSer/pThr/pTyr-binding forkhead associated (FHA) protein
MDEPAISTNSKVVPRDSKSRNQGIPVGYIRHLRHNIEVGRLFSTSTLIIGRDKSAGADIVINDSRGTIARRQTQIGWDHHKKCFWVMDLGSTNGTYLDASTKMKPNEIYYVSTGQTFYLSSSRHPISIVKNETF